MTDEPWKSDRWFSSPWNFLPEIRDGLALPGSVQVHDVTLRDGEQQAGVVFTKDDKLRIAESLAEAGVHRIEAGLPAVSPADDAAVREMVKMGLPSKIYAFSRCMVDDVKRAADCGVEGVVMEIPSSHHLIEKAYRWPVERAIDASIEATTLAHELGLTVSFFPIDATRAGLVEYLDLLEKVATDGHVDAVGLVDTFGVLSPHGVQLFVRQTRERLGVPLETHFHMDFGLGVANTRARRRRGRRRDPDDRHRYRRAGGEHADGGDGPRVAHDVRDGHGDQDRAVLRHLQDGHGAGRRRPAVEPARGRRAAVQRRVGDHLDVGAQRRRRAHRVVPLPARAGRAAGSRARPRQGVRVSTRSWGTWIASGRTATTEQLQTILDEVKGRSLETKGLVDDDVFLQIVDQVTGSSS